MSPKQETALAELKKAHPKGVIMHVSTGTALVKAGEAVKWETTGHGRLMAEYVLA